MRARVALVAALLAARSGAAWADSARTLPAGVWKADARYLFVAGEPIRMHRSLVVPGEMLAPLGLAEELRPGEAELPLAELDLEVQLRAQVLAPGLSYGITDWLSVGAVVPVLVEGAVVVRRFDVEGSWGYNPEFAKDRSRSLLLPAFDARAVNGAAGLQRALVEGFEYEPIRDFHTRGLGDIIVAARGRLWESARTVAAIQPELTLPTGATDDPDNLIDFGPGDGHVDLGATFLADVALGASSVLGLRAGATHTFAHSTTARVYLDPAFPLASRSPLPEPYTFIGYQRPVLRDPGEVLELGAELTQVLHPAWHVTARYGFLASARDQFSDATSRLPALEHGTERRVHTAGAAVRFTLVDLFLRGRAFAPLDLELDLARSFSSSTPEAAMTTVTATATLFFR